MRSITRDADYNKLNYSILDSTIDKEDNMDMLNTLLSIQDIPNIVVASMELNYGNIEEVAFYKGLPLAIEAYMA